MWPKRKFSLHKMHGVYDGVCDGICDGVCDDVCDGVNISMFTLELK